MSFDKILKYLHVYYIFLQPKTILLICDQTLSWRLNSVKLSWASSHIRWLNGESTSSIMTRTETVHKMFICLSTTLCSYQPKKVVLSHPFKFSISCHTAFLSLLLVASGTHGANWPETKHTFEVKCTLCQHGMFYVYTQVSRVMGYMVCVCVCAFYI